MTPDDPLQPSIDQTVQQLDGLRREIHRVIIGQDTLIDRLLIALISGGHVLIEGVPGLAKTLIVQTLADALGLSFQRISFTPDLLPADIIGTMIYHPAEAEFHPKRGPVFTHLLLADEINRAPAKVQSALLEAMQERQVTLGKDRLPLPDPFMVLATQNPLEQEGTYPLPEAQTDRFMLKCRITYPPREDERRIMSRFSTTPACRAQAVLSRDDLVQARTVVDQIHCDARVEDYILDITDATRRPTNYGIEADGLIVCGASPRASLCLHQAARAAALLQGRGFVTPQDVKDMAYDSLRHRIMLSYQADADNIDTDTLIRRILDAIPIP